MILVCLFSSLSCCFDLCTCTFTKTREVQTKLLHYFSKSDDKSNHHHLNSNTHLGFYCGSHFERLLACLLVHCIVGLAYKCLCGFTLKHVRAYLYTHAWSNSVKGEVQTVIWKSSCIHTYVRTEHFARISRLIFFDRGRNAILYGGASDHEPKRSAMQRL